MDNEQLKLLISKLRNGEYDGKDLMQAWIAIEELIKLREWQDKAFEAHPNLDLDIDHIVGG